MTWEQRWHPLREEWVVVAGHRQHRPWQGERRAPSRATAPRHDPACRFCPGNERVGGARNPAYDGVYVFDNDLPVVGPDAPRELAPLPGPLRTAPAVGMARVVCTTPRHDLSLAQLPLAQVIAWLEVLQQQYRELGARPEVAHVLVFENRGEVVGVSNPHPHCQLYATGFVFQTIAREAEVSRVHLRQHGRGLLEQVIAAEREDGRRVVDDHGDALSFVPHFARYPFETFVAPAARRPSLAALSAAELRAFAAVLQRLLRRCDNLWGMPFPYVMAFHQAPTDGGDHEGFHFHVELHPPLRQPDLLKYPAGPEIGGGNYMMDVAVEETAAELRAAGPGVAD